MSIGYDDTLNTWHLESMFELSILYILLIGKGYKLDSICTDEGLSGEGFILLALTKKEPGKIMEYKQLMLCFRNKEGK